MGGGQDQTAFLAIGFSRLTYPSVTAGLWIMLVQPRRIFPDAVVRTLSGKYGFIGSWKREIDMMDLFDSVEKLFAKASATTGTEGVYRFEAQGEEPVTVLVRRNVQVVRECAERPDVVLRVSSGDVSAVAIGTANIEQLFAAGKIAISGNAALATRLPEIIRLSRAKLLQTEDGLAAENRRYPTPSRYSETVSARQPVMLAVDRKHRCDLTIDQFRTRYMLRGRPLIIEDGLTNWKLFQMSREESIEHFAELQGITRHGDYIKSAFSNERDFRTTSMDDFIKSVDQASATGRAPPAYMGNNVLPEKLFDLIERPEYFPASVYETPRIWIGPAGTLTPLHRDASDNFFGQVWGKKHFVLAAPHYRKYLYAWSTTPIGGLDGCDFNPEDPDFGTFPLARNAACISVTVEPGNLLYLPEGWFHQVRSETTSLSVNFWTSVKRRPNESSAMSRSDR